MHKEFILIPGRSSRQGVTLNEGKYTDGYRDEINTLRMNPDDMQTLQISAGDEVRMWNDVGEVCVPVIDAKDECPPGLVFICYGDKSSQLMGGETHGSGMPDSKGLDVFIARLDADNSEESSAPAHVKEMQNSAGSISDDDAIAASAGVGGQSSAEIARGESREQARSLAGASSGELSAPEETHGHHSQTNESSVSSESFPASQSETEAGPASVRQITVVVICILALLMYVIASL